jgi:S1-C subfamily serine protease
MTWLSAVSLVLVLSEPVQNGLTTPLSPLLEQVARERTLTISQFGVVLGQAVMISRDGYAITIGEAAFGEDGAPRPQLRGAQGQEAGIPIKVEAYDPATDLALIRIPLPQEKQVRYVELATRLNSSIVLAQLPSGGARAQITRAGVTGVIGLGKRYMPLNEVRLESSAQVVPGAPIFAPDGKLCGILMASLMPEQAPAAKADLAMEMTKSLAPAAARGGMSMGPQPSATAFSLDLEVLERVIRGYLSSDRRVKHPWIGLMFQSAPSGGALVTEVSAGGPAAQAGLTPGDIITAVDGTIITSQIDLASALFARQVGDRAEFSVLRNGTRAKSTVRIAVEPSAAGRLLRPVRKGPAVVDKDGG